MKIRINTINILLSLMIIFSFMSYEITIYRTYYTEMLILVLGCGFIILLFGLTNKVQINDFYINVKKNLIVYFLLVLILFATLMSSFKLGLVTINGLINVLALTISLYIFYLYIPILLLNKMKDFTKKISLIITIFSIISIIIHFRGNFFGYTATHYQRVSSIFFDPNYFGTLCSVGIILSLYNKGKYKLFAILNLLALIYSGSRGAMLSLFIVMVIFYFYKRKINLKNIILLLISCIFIFFFVCYLRNIDFFRVYQGFSERDLLWRISFDLIKNEPLWGYGNSAVTEVLKNKGAGNISSHNSYLDFILSYGIVPFILYIVVIIRAIYQGFRNDMYIPILMGAFVLLINANSISINLGGLGISSLLLTLFLGICNASFIKKASNSKIDKLK